jgi:tRNA(Ile)-lysidine synthase
LDKSTKIAVAVSGGVDSVYLLHWLIDNGYKNLLVVHFDHNLRPESSKDAEFVKSLARKFNLPYAGASTCVRCYCKSEKVSIELGARELRHKFFKQVQSYGYPIVALAHHANDQAETVLFNFFRGSALTGLKGMEELSSHGLWKPLLNVTKSEIISRACEMGLEWREDSSNGLSEYDRNYLRNEVIPGLEERREGVVKVINRQAEHFSDLNDFVNESVELWMDAHIRQGSFLARDWLKAHKVIRGTVLAKLWDKAYGDRKGFKSTIVRDVEAWLSSNPDGGTKVYFGAKFILTIRKGSVSIIKV